MVARPGTYCQHIHQNNYITQRPEWELPGYTIGGAVFAVALSHRAKNRLLGGGATNLNEFLQASSS